MSAMGDLQAGAGTRPDGDPGLRALFGAALRLTVGWFCVAIGILDLVVELDRRTGMPDGPFLLFHAVLVIGGGGLLALAWIAPRPGVPGYVAGGTVLVGGTLVSALPVATTVCCLPAFTVRHGFPFTFLARDDGTRWHIDGQHLLADLMFWGYAGLIVLVVVAVLHGVTGADDDTASGTEAGGPLP
jgi:hypothetical protein